MKTEALRLMMSVLRVLREERLGAFILFYFNYYLAISELSVFQKPVKFILMCPFLADPIIKAVRGMNTQF